MGNERNLFESLRGREELYDLGLNRALSKNSDFGEENIEDKGSEF